MAASSRKVIYAVLVGDSLIAATRFVAATSTGSAAMLAEGIHSLVDTGNRILLNRRVPLGWNHRVVVPSAGAR